MNLRLFLAASSLLLLSWMAASYVKVSPVAGDRHAQLTVEGVQEVATSTVGELTQLTARQ